MEKENNPLEEMEQEIKRLIADNRKFLDKITDDGFEPEDEETEEFEEL